ncbi:MAG: HAD family hydrolase [Ruminococcaceae bacterium]|nr:HAD family hydrolase [Oscillospiraceae bacterium]
MRDKQYLLFDLDGTVTDSQLGITRSAAYALERFGIHIEDPSTLTFFVGPPLHDTFMEKYGFSDEDAARAVAVYREYYRDTGIFENEVYPGIPELLRDLKAAGRTVILATSKPAVFARRILDHFALSGYFDYLSGCELDGTRSKKDEVIEYALELAGITDRAQCVMIGDREHDIIGAKKTSLSSLGVLYGYGDRAELEAAGADVIVENTAELRNILL